MLNVEGNSMSAWDVDPGDGERDCGNWKMGGFNASGDGCCCG